LHWTDIYTAASSMLTQYHKHRRLLMQQQHNHRSFQRRDFSVNHHYWH